MLKTSMTDIPRFPIPGMDEDALSVYSGLYGEDAECFIGILNTSPEEIFVISRMIAYITEKIGGDGNGSSENS